MNYETLYFKFVEHWKIQQISEGVYTEKHHITPKHMGGGDEKENLVRLTYRQHVFAHRLLWKAYKKACDLMAWRMMSGTDTDVRISRGKSQGVWAAETGHLDRIRLLANTPERQRKFKLMQEQLKVNGHYERMRVITSNANKGRKHSEEVKQGARERMMLRLEVDPDYSKRMQALGVKAKTEKCKEYAISVISNAERNEQYLYKVSKRSQNWFVSPEGLKFHSPIFAAGYYGNVEAYVIENWCKRGEHGWSRIPK